MNILFIGGTRFIGLSALAELIDSGHQVAVFHRGQTEEGVPDGVRHIHGDRANLSAHRAEFAAFRPDVAVDITALTERHARDLVGVMNGIAGRLVVVSTCDVYRNFGLLLGKEFGRAVSERLTEDSPLRESRYLFREQVGPDHVFYDYEKIHVEQVVMNSSIPATCLRFPMVYGPNDRQHRLYTYVKRMADRRPAIMIDRAQVHWRGLRGFRDNCDHAIVTAVLNPEAAGKIYNVGEPIAFTEMEWIENLAEAMHWAGKIIAIPSDHLPDYLQQAVNFEYSIDVDTSRLRHDLGYHEVVSFDDGLQRTIAWELGNPPKYAAAARAGQSVDQFDYGQEDRVLKRVLRTRSLRPQLDDQRQLRLRWF